MTALVERCSGKVDTCSRVAIPIGEENRTRQLRMSQATTVAVPPESLDVIVHSDREIPAPRRPSRRLVLVTRLFLHLLPWCTCGFTVRSEDEEIIAVIEYEPVTRHYSPPRNPAFHLKKI